MGATRQYYHWFEMNLTVFLLILVCDVVFCAIRDNTVMNKLLNIKPVGKVHKTFVPLTELPPPQIPRLSGRRHLEDECTGKPKWKEVHEGGRVDLIGDENYDDNVAKTMATVIMPDHIDYKHFEVTSQVPYLTVGPIEGIGYHHSTRSQSECEKIYDEHMDELYTDETDYSEESLEMARMPIGRVREVTSSLEQRLEDQYDM